MFLILSVSRNQVDEIEILKLGDMFCCELLFWIRDL